MSSSLPRIKTFSELQHRPPSEPQKELKLKFRKISAEGEGPEERKQSIKSIKTERLKSLERYSTAQEQREYRNEKIHLNLIERKLMNGTYDEKKETGHELNAVKQRRDQMKVEMNLKQREIERKRLMLEETRREIAGKEAERAKEEGRLQALGEKGARQEEKTQVALESRGVLENMIKARQDINVMLSKRVFEAKHYLGQLRTTRGLLETEVRELSEKMSVTEIVHGKLKGESEKERLKRNETIARHQETIARRIEGEVFQAQKSKHYMEYLDEMDRHNELRGFHSVYDKILANLFVQRHCKATLIDLQQRYEAHEHAYSQACTAKAFDPASPPSFVARFFQQQPDRESLSQQIAHKEKVIGELEARRAELSRLSEETSRELMLTEERVGEMEREGLAEREREEVRAIREEVEETAGRTLGIKRYILKMLGDLGQKGDRRVGSSAEPTLFNLSKLTGFLLEAYRQTEGGESPSP